MKKLQLGFLVSLFALSIIAINACKKEAFSSDRLAGEKNNANTEMKQADGNLSVSGGGSFDELGAGTTYTFNAVQHNDGATNGHLILHFRAAGGSMYVTIDCLRLFEDNKATMSGVITKLYGVTEGAPPYIFLGGRVSFTVQDNGEGTSGSRDIVSDIGELVPGEPASCADEWPLYLYGANVQIKK